MTPDRPIPLAGRAAAAVLLGACTGSGVSITQLESELLVTPGLVDVGEVAVGDEREFTLQLDHISGGIIQVRAVDVFNVQGDAFSFVGDTPTVPINGTAFAVVRYAPLEHGYDRAVVTVISDAEVNSEVRVDVRGRGVEPTVDRWPSLVDFGPVQQGGTRVREVVVFNDSPVDLVLQSATVDGAGFSLDTAFPLTLPASGTAEIDVRYTAADEALSEADLVFDFGGFAQLSPVVVVANACTVGASALYDEDGDGFTTCAGDCDDGNDRIHPGAHETPDGVDEDCDGRIDQGTNAWDDDGDGYAERDGDCNDADDRVHPGRAEVMGDGIDNDCDGVADTGSDDVDGDGVSPGGGDCNDVAADVHPGAPEVADGADNDCDGLVDEATVLADDDGDGFCESVVQPCSDGALPGDCDDTAADRDTDGAADGASSFPGGVEAPDGVDNDCDGAVDEGTVLADDDGDGYTELAGDCDDGDPDVNPGRVEIRGNGVDDDCDSSTAD